VYLLDSTLHAEDVWYAILDAGKKHQLMVTAPPHCRRIQAGILSWGQDMDNQHNPFQCNLGYQVSLTTAGKWDKKGNYIGKEVLEKMKTELQNGQKPYKLQLVGLEMGGKPIEDFAPDFWPILPIDSNLPCGFITSPWYYPDIGKNIAMGYIPFEGNLNKKGFPIGNYGKKYRVQLPEEYCETSNQAVEAQVVKMPFTQSYHANTREKG
jgi:aminomethyltransferase